MGSYRRAAGAASTYGLVWDTPKLTSSCLGQYGDSGKIGLTVLDRAAKVVPLVGGSRDAAREQARTPHFLDSSHFAESLAPMAAETPLLPNLGKFAWEFIDTSFTRLQRR